MYTVSFHSLLRTAVRGGRGIVLFGVELTASTGSVLLGSLRYLIQHELWDLMGESRGYWQLVRLGLVTVLVSDERDLNEGSVRGGISVQVLSWCIETSEWLH